MSRFKPSWVLHHVDLVIAEILGGGGGLLPHLLALRVSTTVKQLVTDKGAGVGKGVLAGSLWLY